MREQRSKLPLICLPALLALGLLVFGPLPAGALTWQVDEIMGRERLTITLAPEDQTNTDSRAERNGTQSVGLNLGEVPGQIDALTSGGNLVQGLVLENGQLNVATSTPAFGFVASRPAANVIVIDFFQDPLGARWQPEGGLAPAPPVAEPAPQPTNPAEPANLPNPTPAGTEPESAPDNGGAAPAIPETAAQPDPTPLPEQIPPSLQEPASSPEPAADPTSGPASEPAPSVLPEPDPVQTGQTPAENIPVPDFTWPDQEPAERITPPPVATTTPPADEPATSTAVIPADPQPVVLPDPVGGLGGQDVLPQNPDGNRVPLQVIVEPSSNPIQPQTGPTTVTPPQSATPVADPVSQGGGGRTVIDSNAPGQSGTSQAVIDRIQAPYVPGLSGTAPVDVRLAAPAANSDSGQTIVLFELNSGGPQSWPEDQGVNYSPTGALPQTGVGPLVQQPVNTQPGQNPIQSAPPAAVTPAAPQTGLPDNGAVQIDLGAGAQDPDPTLVIDQTMPAPPVPTDQPDPTALPEQTDQGGQDVEPDAVAETPPVELEPIYMDEAGNIIPPPLDIPGLLQQVRDLMGQNKFSEAEPLVLQLLDENLEPADREEMLYFYMDILYNKGRPGFESNAEEVIQAANAAMNFNQQSPRVVRALNTLTMVNLSQENFEETEGYINLIRMLYPNDPALPIIYLSLGEKQLERKNYAEASRALETIVQEFPETNEAAEASRLQTYSLYSQGHSERALAMLDFVERRWPRLYLNDPDFLSMAADIRVQEGKLTEAIDTYWMQYNLTPTEPVAASALQHIGELYFRLGDKGAAVNVLERLVREFPDSPETPLALLRIGENGVYPRNLSLEQILDIFEQPNPRLPSLYYGRILNEYPNSPEAATAELRTLAWMLWSREYSGALTGARSYAIDYADRQEGQVAQDIMLRAFAWELGLAMNEQNSERVISLWESYPQLHQFYEPLEPDVRLALGRSYLARGDEHKGLEILQPFLADGGDPNYGFYTYSVYLDSLLRQQDWGGVLSLGETVSGWNLPLDAQLGLDYAMAMSAQNLGLEGRALPLWQKLAPRDDIPLYQRAYANYFLARNAERRQDLRDTYQYNLDTLGMFVELRDQQSPYANNERIRESIAGLMDVTEIAGRYAEALEWANQYASFVPLDSPDYAGLRLREARLYKKMGDNLRWRSILQSIVDSEPDSVFGQMAAAELRTEDVARDLSRFTQ